jgi:hypothetical protein
MDGEYIVVDDLYADPDLKRAASLLRRSAAVDVTVLPIRVRHAAGIASSAQASEENLNLRQLSSIAL